IMLDSAGRAILMDFGLARPEQDAEQLTSEGVVVGTPSYMAPEQAAGQADRIGPWTDLYSAGVVLYQMLTGRLPLEAQGVGVLARIVQEPAPVPDGSLGLPPDLQTTLMRMLAKNPEQRFQSARQLDAAFADWLASHRVDQRGPSTVASIERYLVAKPG